MDLMKMYRYSIARIQGPNHMQLIQYQAHQTSLMPILAITYATNVVGRYIIHLFLYLS